MVAPTLNFGGLLHHHRRLRPWGRAFAVASLIHLTLGDVQQPGWGPPASLELIGALLLLWRPTLLGFALCTIGTAWPLLMLRDVLTQSMLLTWCGGVATGALLLDRVGHHRAPIQALDAVRWLTAATYLLAAIHKLNPQFFDPTVSCAIHAWAQVADRWMLPSPAPWIAAMPAFVVALEVVLAAGLVLRSPVIWPLGLIFHLPLTVTLAPAFAAVMVSGYVAATTPKQAVHWRRALRQHGALIAVGAFTVAGLDLLRVGVIIDLVHTLKLMAFGALITWSLLAWARPLWRWDRLSMGAATVVALYILHGLTPYVGLQYQHTAAMLSNLRIDDGCENSWLFPVSLTGADDYIRIDRAEIGEGQRPRRERVLQRTLWNVPALHTMHRNWCIPELRPIRFEGTWRGRPFLLEDLCDDDWTKALPGLDGELAGFQRFQKNLLRDCPTACVH